VAIESIGYGGRKLKQYNRMKETLVLNEPRPMLVWNDNKDNAVVKTVGLIHHINGKPHHCTAKDGEDENGFPVYALFTHWEEVKTI
jgi:hypothetical protein